jgi:hypothetical protein
VTVGFFSEDDPRHMAVARALAEGLGYGPYEGLNHNARPVVRDLAEKVVTAVTPLSWLSTGMHGPHRMLAVCPGCGQGDLGTRAMVDLGYEFVVCRCETMPYPHLVEQLWHREHMGRPGERIAATVRQETLHEVVQVLAGAVRTDKPRTPASATFAGGLRRALRLVRQILSETPDAEGAGRS